LTPRWAKPAAIGAGVLVYAALAHDGMRHKSPTFDEVAHLPSGYMHVTRGDFRLVTDPPLPKAAAALPLLAMNVYVPENDHAWARRRHYEFGRRLLFEWNDGQRLITAGRHVMVAWGASLLVLIALSAWSRWGPGVGLLALFLGALHPDLLAHGQLVTTDVPITLLMLASLLHFERLLRHPSPRGAAASGLLLGAAFATKFSSLLLPPLLLALGLAAAASGPRDGLGRRTLRATALLAVVLAVAPFVVWACYGFRARVTPSPDVNEAFRLEPERPQSELLWQATAAAQRYSLLPDAYLYLFLRFARHTEQRRAFLFGELSDQGWWYYFPATLGLKTPLPLLLLYGIALALFARDFRRHARELVLWLPAAAYLAIAVSRNLNIGHRHLLPILPFLLFGAARAAGAIWRRGRAGRALVLVLLGWHALSAARIHPHALAYFNELVGPENGHRMLVDSNLDWGQDLPGLKEYLDRHGIEGVKLSYFGTAEPAFYGIRGERLPGYPPPEPVANAVDPGDLVAVSATNLAGVYLTEDPDAERLMRRLQRQTPVASIGYSILVYRADFRWRRR
jgi:hypothetical protein